MAMQEKKKGEDNKVIERGNKSSGLGIGSENQRQQKQGMGQMGYGQARDKRR
jgi:hypothetical protein